eukprot:4579064-Amphidinium_carterae.1
MACWTRLKQFVLPLPCVCILCPLSWRLAKSVATEHHTIVSGALALLSGVPSEELLCSNLYFTDGAPTSTQQHTCHLKAPPCVRNPPTTTPPS